MNEQEFETILWSFDEETGIGTLVLDRPEAHNALSKQLKAEVHAGIEEFEALDDEVDGVAVRAVVVEGAGPDAFCAGADYKEFDERSPAVFDPTKLFDTIEEYDAPVIAKIDGYCFGGGMELALACDFRLASEGSELGQVEVNLGVIPGGGGTQRLPPLVGPSRAKELCMTGEQLSAKQAGEEGIVDHVYPDDEFDERVDEFVERIASKAPLAVRAINDAVNMSQEMGMREGRRYEYRAFLPLLETEDRDEGVAAFQEGREPEFKGK